jgi:Carboxypeptidase regulatory-like domain
MKYIMRLVVIAMAAVGMCALPIGAQTISAALSGHVVDQSKGAVPNATVRLVDELTNVAVSTHTNSNGDFIFTNVQPGTYRAIVTANGYKELSKVDLVLSAATNLDAGVFVLQVGTVAQSVTVEAAITPLQTTSSERSSVLDTEQMDNLLAIGRDPMSMTRIMPGVVQTGEGASSLSTTTIPVTNGVNNEYGMATVDGVVSNTRGLATMDTPINLDAVKEISVAQSNYQAQYGKTAGAEFNFVTKSGTSRFHGGLYYYFRNEDLNASSYFDKYGFTPSTYKARPRYRYNTAGGTIGGPVYWPGHFNANKDKLFFFVSIEDDPTTSPDGLKYYMMPTQQQVNGDFSATYNQKTATQTPSTLINIAMPGQAANCKTNSATPGSGCFPGNIIPQGMINTQGQYLLQNMYNNTLKLNPSYAYNNLAISQNNYNYITNYSASKPVNQQIFRIDYAPTENLHMFFRGDLTTANDTDYSSPANDLPWLMPVNYKLGEPNFVFNIIYTFTPTLVNEFNIGTAGWSETQLYAKSDLAKVTLSSSTFNLPSLYSGVNPLNLFPAASYGLASDSPSYNWDSRFPMADQVRSYNATEKVTKVLGNHTLVFGVDVGTDAYLQVNHNRVGTFNFSNNTNNPNDSNFGYSNGDLGVLYTYSQDTQLLNYDPRTNAAEWYYQDTWKARSNLTLDFGIRNSWAMAQRLARGNNFVPSLYSAANAPALYIANSAGKSTDPTTGIATYPAAYAGLMVPNTGNLNNGILYVNTPGYPQGTTYGNGILWAPRVGFAWSVRPSTVIRGGFGMFYNVRARSGQEGDLTNNAPTTNGPEQFYSSINASASNYYASPGASNLNGPFGIGHALPLHTKEIYAEEGSLGVQQEVPFGVVLDVAYVGTFTKHASDYSPINEVPYNSEYQLQNQYCSAVNTSGAGKGLCSKSATLPDNFFRPYPGLGSINMQNFNLTANYNSLQVKVTRRFHNGLEFGGAYTFGRAMDYTDSYNGTISLYQPLRSWNYAPASWDIKHMLVVNYLYALPRASQAFGGNSGWNNIATRQAFDGWQISGFASYYSGTPALTTVSINGSPNLTGGGDGSRAVQTCDPQRKVHGTRTFNQWFNTGCVENMLQGTAATVQTYTSAGAPVASTAAVPYSTGNGVFAGRYNYFNPGDVNFDTALFKNMPIENKVTLQLRVETYNTFNHTEFNGVNNSAAFGNATVQGPTNPQTSATFGQLNSAANPRYMQLALRIDF